jgi:hypothetical protein
LFFDPDTYCNCFTFLPLSKKSAVVFFLTKKLVENMPPFNLHLSNGRVRLGARLGAPRPDPYRLYTLNGQVFMDRSAVSSIGALDVLAVAHILRTNDIVQLINGDGSITPLSQSDATDMLLNENGFIPIARPSAIPTIARRLPWHTSAYVDLTGDTELAGELIDITNADAEIVDLTDADAEIVDMSSDDDGEVAEFDVRGEPCPICLEHFNAGDRLVILSCDGGHMFCEECYKKQIEIDKKHIAETYANTPFEAARRQKGALICACCRGLSVKATVFKAKAGGFGFNVFVR